MTHFFKYFLLLVGLLANLFLICDEDDLIQFNDPPFILGVEHGGSGDNVVDVYEHVLSHIQAFLVDATRSEMKDIEKILLATLVKDDQSSLLSQRIVSDLWCFLAR